MARGRCLVSRLVCLSNFSCLGPLTQRFFLFFSFEIKRLIIRSWIKEINITDEGDIKLKVRVPVFEGVPFKIPDTNTISSGKVCPVLWARKLAENHSVPEV